MELKDLIDAFCNIFNMIDWCCIVGLLMAYHGSKSHVKKDVPTISSKRGLSKGKEDKTDTEEKEKENTGPNRYFLISLIL